MNKVRAATGMLLILFAVSSSYSLPATGDDREDGEGKISLKQVPDKVQATMLAELLHEIKALTVEEIEREEKGGVVVYEAEFEIGDLEIELEIDATGKLLSKEVSHEEDDDDDE